MRRDAGLLAVATQPCGSKPKARRPRVYSPSGAAAAPPHYQRGRAGISHNAIPVLSRYEILFEVSEILRVPALIERF